MRGSTSSLSGSYVQGGAAPFITKNPADYLPEDRGACFCDRFVSKLLDVHSRKKIDGIVEILPLFIQAVESEESKVIANWNIDKVFAEGMESAPSGTQASLDRDVHGALEPCRPALKW